MAREFRFSFNVFSVLSRKGLQDRCRRAESAGYDTVFAADHLGAPAPFPLLVAAADATERLRVGTLVLKRYPAAPRRSPYSGAASPGPDRR